MSGLYENLSGAAAARAEGKSAENIALYNAAVMEQEAKAIRQKAAFGQKRQAKRAERIKSALVAKVAAAGGLGSPVAADLAVEQAAELELENLLIGYEGEVGAQRALSQAELDRLQGRLAKLRGKAAGRARNIQFGMQLASMSMPFLGGFGGGASPTQIGAPGTLPTGTGRVYA